MGNYVAFLGSTNTGGGGAIKLATCISTVKVNNKSIATTKDSTAAAEDDSCHNHTTHCKPGPKKGSSTVFAKGYAVHRMGDKRSCSHTTNSGSTNVKVGD